MCILIIEYISYAVNVYYSFIHNDSKYYYIDYNYYVQKLSKSRWRSTHTVKCLQTT